MRRNMSILDYFNTKPKETDKFVESANVRGNLMSIEKEEICKQLKQIQDKGKRRRKYRVWKLAE